MNRSHAPKAALFAAALCAIALASLSLASCAKSQKAWITDIDEAKKEAVKTKKPLLIAFTGSDWNEESKTLATNVFTEEFFSRGTARYVLCNIDIRENEEGVDQAVAERNYKAAEALGIKDIPALCLLTPAGDVFGNTQLDPTLAGPEAFYVVADAFLDKGKTLADLRRKADSAKGIERAKGIDAFLEALAPNQRDKYGEMIREIPELDADGKAGLKGKYLLQIAYLDAITLFQDGKLTQAGDSFFTLAGAGGLTPAQEQEAWYMGAYMYAMSETVDNSLVVGWLEKSLAADPEGPGAANIKSTLEQIRSTMGK